MSDPLRIIASPLVVLDADGAIEEIAGLCDEYLPDVVVIGLPITLKGQEGTAAEGARRLGVAVAERTGRPVEYIDERFTSTTAEAAMLEGDVKRRDRRANLDKVAAAVILRTFLERNP